MKPEKVVKPEKPTEFKAERKNKDFITNAIMRQQMGGNLESLKNGNPAVYKELEQNGYIENGKVTGKGQSLLMKK